MAGLLFIHAAYAIVYKLLKVDMDMDMDMDMDSDYCVNISFIG